MFDRVDVPNIDCIVFETQKKVKLILQEETLRKEGRIGDMFSVVYTRIIKISMRYWKVRLAK